MKNLYEVKMGNKNNTVDCTLSSGTWWVIARSIPEAKKKAERGDNEKAISVRLVVTERLGLKP